MSARRTDSQPTPDFDRIAAEWLVKRDRGLTAAEQDEFFQWLAADPRHGEWFARHQQTWTTFDLLAEWRPEHSAEPNPDLLARPRPAKARWVAPAVLAMAAAASIVAGFMAWRPAAREIHERQRISGPPVAQAYERRTLHDGSIVELNRGAAIEARFTTGERRVVLAEGEAHFTVAKDPARPFVVHARGVGVRAVGTAFNVKLDRAAVEVLVTHGRVQLDQGMDSVPATTPARDAHESREGLSPDGTPANALPELAAGDRAVVALAAPLPPHITKVSRAQIARALAWQPPQLLDFSSVPLGRVLEEFNRRNPVELVLADPDLADVLIVASIRSDNVDGFVRFLASTAGVEAEQRSAEQIVLRRKR